jgi:thymidylate synthase
MTRADHILVLCEDVLQDTQVLDFETETLLRNFDEGLFHAIKSLFKKKEPAKTTAASGHEVRYDWRSPRSNDTGIFHYAMMKAGNDFDKAISYLGRVKSNFEKEAKENGALKKVVDNIEKAIAKLKDQKHARQARYHTGGAFTHGYAAAHA